MSCRCLIWEACSGRGTPSSSSASTMSHRGISWASVPRLVPETGFNAKCAVAVPHHLEDTESKQYKGGPIPVRALACWPHTCWQIGAESHGWVGCFLECLGGTTGSSCASIRCQGWIWPQGSMTHQRPVLGSELVPNWEPALHRGTVPFHRPVPNRGSLL